ncbi:hypothetical protein [Burkholderia sp. BCC0419]|uniref:hypothetical protein n=1 Tax=Burkholderia sp. BCC0419 TaxID=486878 RepID=UPI001589E9EC|nr:hypothetical protein [Burkholderia sp. BCC0419]
MLVVDAQAADFSAWKRFAPVAVLWHQVAGSGRHDAAHYDGRIRTRMPGAIFCVTSPNAVVSTRADACRSAGDNRSRGWTTIARRKSWIITKCIRANE